MKSCITARFVLTLLAVCSASRLIAASFVVTDLADAGPGTLRQAILDANATVGDDNITFATNGTITLVTELPAISDNLVIVGPGIGLLTVSGNSQVRLFHFNAGTTNSISDLTIADGFARGIEQIGNGPGSIPAVYTNASGIASYGSLAIRRCVVQNCRNNLFSLGAGVFNAGVLEIGDCVVTNCRPLTFSSGGNHTFGAGLYNTGTVSIAYSVISGCSAGAWGGTGSGIYNTKNGRLIAVSTQVQNCTGYGTYSDGGGIVNSGDVVLENCLISNCRGYWAGGIYSSGGSLIMTNTTVRNCGANIGSGILLSGSGTGLLHGCTIISNACTSVSPYGAGVLNVGMLTIYNSTLSKNWNAGDATLPGTAISDNWNNSTGTTILNHCTVVSNSGPAEIWVQGNFSAANSIIGTIQGTNTSGGHNLIVNTNGCVITGDIAGNIYNVDPLLGPLQDNGGPTWTHALLAGSPAIDQAGNSELTTDQRGFARPTGPASDVGAFEVVPFFAPTLSIQLATAGSALISWPTPPAGFVLQQNSGFGSGDWSDVGIAPTDNGIKRWVTLPVSEDQKFFRLRSP